MNSSSSVTNLSATSGPRPPQNRVPQQEAKISISYYVYLTNGTFEEITEQLSPSQLQKAIIDIENSEKNETLKPHEKKTKEGKLAALKTARHIKQTGFFVTQLSAAQSRNSSTIKNHFGQADSSAQTFSLNSSNSQATLSSAVSSTSAPPPALYQMVDSVSPSKLMYINKKEQTKTQEYFISDSESSISENNSESVLNTDDVSSTSSSPSPRQTASTSTTGSAPKPWYRRAWSAVSSFFSAIANFFRRCWSSQDESPVSLEINATYY